MTLATAQRACIQYILHKTSENFEASDKAFLYMFLPPPNIPVMTMNTLLSPLYDSPLLQRLPTKDITE